MRYLILRRSGELLDEKGNEVRRFHGGRLLLSRALCSFARFETSSSLTRRQQAKAARSFADARAPFSNAGSLLIRRNDGVDVWWWNPAEIEARLGNRLKANVEICVESACFVAEPHPGWRQVATVDGYEAQYWRDGALIGTMWRPSLFDRSAWASFALQFPEAGAPEAPPDPVAVPMAMPFDVRGARVGGALTFAHASLAILVCTVAAVAVSAFNMGRVVRAEMSAPPRPEMQGGGSDGPVALVAEYAALTQKREAATVLTQALTLAHQLDVSISRWSLKDGRLALRTRAEASAEAAAKLVEQLEASRAVDAIMVRATEEPGAFEIEARVRQRER